MNLRIVILLLAVATGACRFDGKRNADAKKAWAKCIFELDKVEAVRGRNLDDLDKGFSVARNQFMGDCLWAQHEEFTTEQMKEMSDYAATKQNRTPNDISLNNGKR